MYEGVSGKRTGEVVSWFHRDAGRSNPFCLYGGEPVGMDSGIASDKEHLIARNFVPTGSLASGFNFQFRACRSCNERKGNAERHVSTITLLNSPARATDLAVDILALRKARKDFHPRKQGRLVKDASEELNLRGTLGPGLSIKAQLVAPPQLDAESVALLACNQVQALFALCTSPDHRDPSSMRLLPASQWQLFGDYPSRDWGNPQLVEISARVAAWPYRAKIWTANGYFRAVLRANDTGPWFWALEWNKSLRVYGAIANAEDPLPVFANLPELEWVNLAPDIRSRVETPESEGVDGLFSESVA